MSIIRFCWHKFRWSWRRYWYCAGKSSLSWHGHDYGINSCFHGRSLLLGDTSLKMTISSQLSLVLIENSLLHYQQRYVFIYTLWDNNHWQWAMTRSWNALFWWHQFEKDYLRQTINDPNLWSVSWKASGTLFLHHKAWTMWTTTMNFVGSFSDSDLQHHWTRWRRNLTMENGSNWLQISH